MNSHRRPSSTDMSGSLPSFLSRQTCTTALSSAVQSDNYNHKKAKGLVSKNSCPSWRHSLRIKRSSNIGHARGRRHLARFRPWTRPSNSRSIVLQSQKQRDLTRDQAWLGVTMKWPTSSPLTNGLRLEHNPDFLTSFQSFLWDSNFSFELSFCNCWKNKYRTKRFWKVYTSKLHSEFKSAYLS